MKICDICPRQCNIERKDSAEEKGALGFCQMPLLPHVARAGLHFWEEPCISGTRGSGTVFFSGCNLRCVFCQNYEISYLNKGKELTVTELRALYEKLIKQGAHNINLVTPTHYLDAVLASLDEPLSVPVVYNTGTYENIASLKKLKGKVQVYLPDLKYCSGTLSKRYSHADDYFAVATAAIKEMYAQTGPYVLDKDGIMQSGTIIRHLILPGQVEDSKRIMDWVCENFKPGEVMFSLMHQYVPCGKAAEFPEINRKLTSREYKKAEDYLLSSAIEDGFIQEEDSADSQFIPDFDYTGL